MESESINAAEPTTPQVRTKLPRRAAAENPKPERIRAELNIERWPAMWQPSKSKTRSKKTPKVRTMEREVTFADGSRGTAKLEVGFTQFGTITTEDQRMFYALVKQWEDSGKPTSQVYFSDRLLSRLLKKSWGTNVIEAITSSLRRLRLTPLRWIKSYHRSESPERQVEEEVPFTMLSDLKIIKQKVDGHVTNQQGYFQFDRNLLENLRGNYTKPLLFEEFLKLSSEIGQLIYSHIDLIMSDKTRYERCTKDLFRDLGLGDIPFYRHASHRKQVLERAIKELHGIGLSTGTLRSAALEKTKDGKDYKIVFQKGSRTARTETDERGEVDNQTLVINHYAGKPQELLLQQAEDLVQHFHRVVHNVANHYSQPKELSQALSLITQHGFEKAKYVVEFAARKAGETNFQIQQFGATLSYIARALADHERSAQSEPERRSAPIRIAKAARPNENRQLGENRLELLSPAQYAARYEQTRMELCQLYPGMARLLSQKESASAQKTIRGWMIRRLSEERWDLLIVGGLADPEVVRRKLGLQNLPC